MSSRKKPTSEPAKEVRGNVREAADVAGMGQTHYEWLQSDTDYAAAFDAATEDAGDVLEAEAWRRAVDGVEEPTGWYQGVPGGKVRKDSDTLLIFLLKRPEGVEIRRAARGGWSEQRAADRRLEAGVLIARRAQAAARLLRSANRREERG